MTARELIHIINNGNNLSELEYQSLVQLHREFPYFVLPSILAAKYERKDHRKKDNEFLYHSATQSPDRKRLKFLLENPIPFLPFLPDQEASEESTDQANFEVDEYVAPIPDESNLDEEEKESEQISSKVQEKEVPDEKNEVPIPAHAPVKKKRKDVLKELEENLSRLKSAEQDDSPAARDLPSNLHAGEDSHELELMAAIRAREEKNIQDEKKQIQDELIDEFNKKTVKFKIIPNTEEAGETTDLSLESTRIKEDLLSESFAKILVRQKKFKEAKEIYKKLQLKFPDKKAYFADCLKQLENN